MRPRAFLVIGPEDSGNRMMHNFLIAAGCAGKPGYDLPFPQPFDEELPPAEGDISWIRSVPHNGALPDIEWMILTAREKGYEPIVLVMTRPWWIVMRSQKKRCHTPHKADQIIRQAYLWIFATLLYANCTYYLISYAELTRQPKSIPMLCELLKLPVPKFEFRSENDKYYDRCRDSAV